MACNCGNKNALYRGAANLGRANPIADSDGMYILASAPDCTTPYSGAYINSTVFVVGFGTENETLYSRADRSDAIAHARESNLTIDQLPARSLCHNSMVTLLGA